MAFYYCARVLQEHSDFVRKLASDFNIPEERIVFNTEGFSIGFIGVYIKFDSENSKNEFSKRLNKLIPEAIEPF